MIKEKYHDRLKRGHSGNTKIRHNLTVIYSSYRYHTNNKYCFQNLITIHRYQSIECCSNNFMNTSYNNWVIQHTTYYLLSCMTEYIFFVISKSIEKGILWKLMWFKALLYNIRQHTQYLIIKYNIIFIATQLAINHI